MGLSFLAPMLLGGAALVAVPVMLHMLMRQKPVKREFPALRFLKTRVIANRRRLRLTHLLLLLARMAALAVLALAMARPVLRNAGWLADAEGPVAAVLVFDTAPRMAIREANRTRLDQAKAMARAIFDKLPPTSDVAVIDTAGGQAGFLPTLAAAAARVDRLDTATPSNTLASAMAEGLRLLETSDLPRRELYVFTDCSRGGLAGASPLAASDLPADTRLLWIDVGAASPSNFSIDSIELAADRLSAGAPLVISAGLGRTGPEASRAVAVEVLGNDGRYVRRAVKPITWKPSVAGEVVFEIGGLEPGVRQGRLLVDGSDDLPADDVRYFTVEVGAPSRVLIAAPAPGRRTGMFMAEAIAPAALAKAGRSRFDAVLVDAEKLDATAWDGFDAIVLVDPPPLPPRAWEQLREWVSVGRGLIVWLGPRAGDPAQFTSQPARQLLGGEIVRVWRSPDETNFLAPTALDHPALAAFRRVGDSVPWQDFPVRRHWEFAPDEGPAAAVPVALYRNGLPAILEHRVGQGTVMVVTTPVSQSADDPDAWNMLATGFEPWPFVILANEMLLHAIDTSDDRNITAGQTAVLNVGRRDVATVFVRTPTGDEVPVAVDARRGTVTIADTHAEGNYIVRSGGEAGGFAKGFSANLAPPATDFTRLAPEQLAVALGPEHRLARTENDLVRDVALGRVGAELFGWLILVAAVAMAVDWMLANRFYAPLEQTSGSTAAEAWAVETAVAPAARSSGRTRDRSIPPPLPEDDALEEVAP
ncbi:MAG: BatA domain-containing protein [Planctomycetia bacterium]